MKLKLKAPISTSIAIAVGLIVIIGYFIDVPIYITLRELLLHCAIILAALALIIGIFNLIYVHIHKISSQSKGDVYSMILLISLILTVIITLVFSPTGEMPIWLFNYIVIPAEASLLALLAAILIYFCIRLFKRGVTLFSVIFVFTVLIILMGTVSLTGFQIPGLSGPNGIGALLVRIPSVGGARGILIGVALGAIATGIRVILGADRPYNG